MRLSVNLISCRGRNISIESDEFTSIIALDSCIGDVTTKIEKYAERLKEKKSLSNTIEDLDLAIKHFDEALDESYGNR